MPNQLMAGVTQIDAVFERGMAAMMKGPQVVGFALKGILVRRKIELRRGDPISAHRTYAALPLISKTFCLLIEISESRHLISPSSQG